MIDLPDWRPTATRAALAARAALVARVRGFFAARGLLEVETPALAAAPVTDPNIESFAIAGAPRWLQTSPEYAMKRLLAAGVGDCWQLARVFRAGEAGPRHNPEFSLLEWYRVGWDHQQLAGEVLDLLRDTLGAERVGAGRTLTYAEAFLAHADLDPHRADDDTLAARVRALGADATGLDRDARLDLIASLVVHPALGRDGAEVVTDFPASQAALARIRPGAVPVAERFEVFLAGVELANGYHELGDAGEQAARFAADAARRRARGQAAPAADQRLLAALAAGLPACAGVALGFDRLVMLATGADRIDAVLAFPWDRA